MRTRKKKTVQTNPVAEAVNTIASGVVMVPILIVEGVFSLFDI